MKNTIIKLVLFLYFFCITFFNSDSFSRNAKIEASFSPKDNYNFRNKFIENKFFNKTNFQTIYFSKFKNENVQLINKIYEKYISELIIDNNEKTIFSNYIFSEPGLHRVIFSLDIEKMNSISNMFSDIPNLIYFEANNKSENNIFESMREMFKNCQNLKVVDFGNNIYSDTIDLSNMFENCISLTSLKLPLCISKKTENISYMFANCSSLKSVEFPNFITINIKDMSGLFYGCTNLQSIDLSNFNSKNLRNIKYMFAGCSSLTSINIEFFKMNMIEDYSFLFLNCSNLNSVKLPHIYSNQTINFSSIFMGCNNLSSAYIKRIESRLIKNNDICIIGLWYGSNYGSMLTYYALHEVFKRMGYSILMINDPLEPNDINYSNIHPKIFTKDFYKISEKKNLNDLSELNKICRCFLVGSDQLWNIDLSRALEQFYFLGFVDDDTRKLSYGTSFGRDYEGTEEEKIITKKNLKRFDGISVRDELSLNILKETFEIDKAVQVCDPTLLCELSDYIKLIEKSNISFTEEYLLTYILDPNPEIGNRLEQLSNEKGIKIIIILDHPPDIWEYNREMLSLTGKGNIELKKILNLNEWLYYYKNSKAIFTDSYHGTIFSIIFRKPFITLKNMKRGGERFLSLLKPLRLIYRLFETPDCINKNNSLFDNINYTIPIKQLSKIKENSYNWLKNELHFLL